MADPLTGWLSYVDQLLALIAHISVSLAKISGSAALILGSVLSMWTCVRNFRRGLEVKPVSRCKPTAGRRLAKRDQDSGRST